MSAYACVCLKCGRQSAIVVKQGERLEDVTCPHCGARALSKITPSNLFYGAFSGGG